MPYKYLYPAILAFCSIGVYSINNTNFDVMQTAAFGFLGVVFVKLECSCRPTSGSYSCYEQVGSLGRALRWLR